MTFTDDDLKRLKEQMSSIPGIVWGIVWGLKESEQFNLSALLARVEAAEKVAELLSLSWAGEAAELVKAWRKAAGR